MTSERYIINITFHLHRDLLDEFRCFLGAEVMPLIAGGSLRAPFLSEVLPHEPVAEAPMAGMDDADREISCALMWDCTGADTSTIRHEAQEEVVRPLFQRFGERVLFFITLLRPFDDIR